MLPRVLRLGINALVNLEHVTMPFEEQILILSRRYLKRVPDTLQAIVKSA